MPLPNVSAVGATEAPFTYITRTVDCSAGVTDQAVDLTGYNRVTGCTVVNLSGPVTLKFGGIDMEENPAIRGFFPLSLPASLGIYLNCPATGGATITLLIGVR